MQTCSSDSVYSNSDKRFRQASDKETREYSDREAVPWATYIAKRKNKPSSADLQFLREQFDKNYRQAKRKKRNHEGGNGRREWDSRQNNYYGQATSQKKEQDTIAAGTNKPREHPSFSTSIVTDPEIRQSPFTTCWTTFTGSDEKSLLPWLYLVGPYTRSVPRWCHWCIKQCACRTKYSCMSQQCCDWW